MRRLMFALFAVALTMTLVGATALARPTGPTESGVSAVDGTGRTLPRNPLLKAGERVVVVVDGFAPGAPVEVRGLDGGYLVTADARGVARYALTVPAAIAGGVHVVRLIGAPRSVGGVLRGTVSVSVPRLGEFVFRTPGPRTGPDSGVGGVVVGPGTSGGGLADTGVPVATLLTAAGASLGLGGLLAGAGRRRQAG